MIAPDVRKVIELVLQERLKPLGYDRADIVEDRDHDGDEVLRITIHYKRVGASVDPTPTFSLARHVREAIGALGEHRFPHFTHLFPDDQELRVA